MKSALSFFIDAVLAYHEQAFDAALQLTEQAAQAEPDSLFYQQAVMFLRETAVTKSVDVYVSPEGFEQFIRGGGNLPLYTNTSALLNQAYRQSNAKTLLDIGVGDGHALLPALSDSMAALDLVEPSAAMLDKLAAELQKQAVAFRAFPMPWQQFRDQLAPNTAPAWDIIQMTFSAHTFLPEERATLLGWCATHGKQLMIAEFDVPLFTDMLTPEVIGYYVAKYERGLAEYPNEPKVMQGFLLPVFFGNFAHNSERVTFEQTAVHWQTNLENAGFTAVQKVPIYDYWWAPAFMLTAKGRV
ncbi:MAG: class I SAM-dependent methyltransferase [Anaerolineales bacterium]|nr:class I SAM-dependent methyltransferase [Anaerolineales bacterium]